MSESPALADSVSAFAFVVTGVSLTRDELSPDSIKAGNPEVYSKVLSESEDGKIIRGIWKCTVGTVTDTEQDEMFTIIEGRATVTIENGPVLELSPGVVGFFKFGTKTTWVIREDLLKTFQITLQS